MDLGKKIFGEGQIKTMLSEYTQGKISFGKFVELLNEIASSENGCLESKLAESEKIREFQKNNALFTAACELPAKDAEIESLRMERDEYAASANKYHDALHNQKFTIDEMEKEIARLKEFEFMYKDLCK